jgi:hypothetical protein
MCEQKFGIVFKINIACIDEEHNEEVSLVIKRKGLSVIPQIGMHLIFGKYDFEITGISTPLSFDVITCRCQIFKPLTREQVNELMTTYHWREDLKHGEVSKFNVVEDEK